MQIKFNNFFLTYNIYQNMYYKRFENSSRLDFFLEQDKLLSFDALCKRLDKVLDELELIILTNECYVNSVNIPEDNKAKTLRKKIMYQYGVFVDEYQKMGDSKYNYLYFVKYYYKFEEFVCESILEYWKIMKQLN